MIDSPTKQPENRVHLFDPVGLINDSYPNHGFRAIRATRSSDVGSALTLTADNKGAGESEASSPRLWKTRRPDHHHHRPMSPDSRTKAIASGRRELMEMVKDLPESFYELSLRDIVEQKSPAMEDPNEKEKRSGKKVGKSESRKKMVKSRSIENGGFLLKTSVFPISFGLKKKKSLRSTTASFKVAPKPPSHAPASSNSGSSSGSSSSSRRGQSNRFIPSCCSFKAKK